MAKGYWVANGEVSDMETYKKYVEANAAAFSEYGARFLVRGGQGEVKEGTVGSRVVVLEFESYEKALACYHSDVYEKAIAIRKPAAELNLVVIEGYDGPQPGDG